MIDFKNLLVEVAINDLKHRIVLGGGIGDPHKFLDPFDTQDAHGLGDLNGIGAPGCNHFLPRADKISPQGLIANEFRVAEEPGQFFKILFYKGLANAKGIKNGGNGPKKYNHFTMLLVAKLRGFEGIEEILV